MEIGVTVFTPTFNRGYIIESLFNSLKEQQCKNFEWVVVDDGSSDNTKELFNEWSKEDFGFPVRYFYKENGGKHRAINYALDKAQGRLFFIVDSDDYILEDAVKIILENEAKLENKESYAGIGFNRGEDEFAVIGSTFKGEWIDASSIERKKYNILGDKAEVFYTDVLKKYRFPEFDNENFITEITMWYKIANDGYKIRWFNQIIYICDYLDDGLTKNLNNLFLNNFNGYTYTVKEIIKYNLKIEEKLKMIGAYSTNAKNIGYSYREISKKINVNILICYLLEKIYEVKKLLK